MVTKAQWFELYVQAGLQPIAVYLGKKAPVGLNWNRNWNAEKWRPYFDNDNDNAYDMGILLGNIVDVEGDTEEANDLLHQMTEYVPHPKFRSSKSTHHLFLNPDPSLTRKVFNGMEFRAHKHQSVVPPSTHEFGSKYGWLVGSKLVIPDMPDELLRYYQSHTSKQKEKMCSQAKDGFTQMSCRACKNEFFIHEKRLFLEVKAFQEYKLPWMCHKCREFDLRQRCRVIRESLQKNSLFFQA